MTPHWFKTDEVRILTFLYLRHKYVAATPKFIANALVFFAKAHTSLCIAQSLAG